MLSVLLRQRPGAPGVLVKGIHWRFLPPCCCLFERRRGRVNTGEFSGIFLPVLVGVLDFGFVDFLVCFSVLPCEECQMAGLTSRRTSCLTGCATARQVGLSRIFWLFLRVSEGFQVCGLVDLSVDFSVLPRPDLRSTRFGRATGTCVLALDFLRYGGCS